LRPGEKWTTAGEKKEDPVNLFLNGLPGYLYIKNGDKKKRGTVVKRTAAEPPRKWHKFDREKGTLEERLPGLRRIVRAGEGEKVITLSGEEGGGKMSNHLGVL